MNARDKTGCLSEQKQALSTYLDNLLAQVEVKELTPAVSDAPEREKNTIKPSPEPAVQAASAPPLTALEQDGGVVIEAALSAPALIHPLVPISETPTAQVFDEPFPCLLFHVHGLKLAVPLIELNGVLPWSDEITPMPNHNPWFLGVLRHQGISVKVVDTAMLVMPQTHRDAAQDESATLPRNIILVGDGHWGLACSGIEEMITLHPKDVRWRSQKGSRRWLAGTVIEHMCALLDVSAFAKMLESGY